MDSEISDKIFLSEGFFYLGKLISKVDAVIAIVHEYGYPSTDISIEEAASLVEANTVKASPLENERVAFCKAGISFNFIGDFLDVSSLPTNAAHILERIKEAKSTGYLFAKEILPDLIKSSLS